MSFEVVDEIVNTLGIIDDMSKSLKYMFKMLAEPNSLENEVTPRIGETISFESKFMNSVTCTYTSGSRCCILSLCLIS